ncbi:hypothetical protein ACQJBY_025450 [Aegilops geniculata]
MGRKVCISPAILALVVLAGLRANAAAFAGGAAASMDAALAVRQLTPTLSSMKLEDAVLPELAVDLEVHRRILLSIPQRTMDPNRQACLKNGCPADGGAYTDRGCLKKYGCSLTPPQSTVN